MTARQADTSLILVELIPLITEPSSNQPLASPPEVAILSTIVTGGTFLSLKAHFLSELPDISCLSATLTHLNLSYNSLQVHQYSSIQVGAS